MTEEETQRGYWQGHETRQREYEKHERELWKALNAVNDRDTFLAFVRVMIQDAHAWSENAGDYGWRNGTDVRDCFEATLARFTLEDGTARDLPEEPSWQTFAEFLNMGRIYE